jgi:hypothetical protein
MTQLTPGERVAVGDRIGIVARVDLPYVFVDFGDADPEPHTVGSVVSIPSFG